jgi:hypothetical protein
MLIAEAWPGNSLAILATHMRHRTLGEKLIDSHANAARDNEAGF